MVNWVAGTLKLSEVLVGVLGFDQTVNFNCVNMLTLQSESTIVINYVLVCLLKRCVRKPTPVVSQSSTSRRVFFRPDAKLFCFQVRRKKAQYT